MTERRIDVHHHAMPAAVKAMMVDRGLLPPVGGPPFVHWDVDTALATMDAHDIEVAIASAAVPTEFLGDDPAWAARLARTANEALAGLAADRPDRFGFLAYLPLPYVDEAVAEAAYALDELGADGVILACHMGEVYLGDTAFDPVMAELDRRGAVALLHPFALPSGGSRLFPPFLADFMLDTTRAAINLVVSATLTRYPDISFVLPHSGGTLPYQASRIAMSSHLGTGADAGTVEASLRRFYYDTAAPMSPHATPTLLAAAGAGRILYGSDYNAITAEALGYADRALRADPALDADARWHIGRGNALALFPGIRRRLGLTPIAG